MSETLSVVTNGNRRYINWRASEASETLSGVTQSRFRYIYLFIYLFIYMVRRTTFSARASNRKEGGVKFQSFLKQ